MNIDGVKIQIKKEKTILEAALDAGIYIPNLCYHPEIEPVGACRLCIVEIEGRRGFIPACITPAEENMKVSTNTDALKNLRQNLVWLTLSEYNGKPEKESQLQKVIQWIGEKNLLPEFKVKNREMLVSTNEPLYQKDLNLCILCGKCTRMCQEVRGVGAIGIVERGIKSTVGTQFDALMVDTSCKFCGACVEVCPSGALKDIKAINLNDEEAKTNAILPCQTNCPAHIDVPLYVGLMSEGKHQEALEVIREKVPFPHSLGLVCPHPCENECQRGAVNQAISIRELKRFAAEKDNGRWLKKLPLQKKTGKNVAVIGAGPAGLTAAWYLTLKGHQVTVFEVLKEAGGMMRSAIPRYRLPNAVLAKEIKYITDLGVKVLLNQKITDLDKISQNNDAVFLAIGATKGTKMNIPGENDPRVLDGIAVLEKINFGEKINLGKKIAVVGGGNVAMDVARSALRLGVKEVSIVYRRTEKEMPAWQEEIDFAKEEGVKFQFLVNPLQIKSSTGALQVECIRMELGQPDESGRRKPMEIKGSEFIMDLDYLIMAIGQNADIPVEFGITADKYNTRIQTAKNSFQTSREKVFAGGDAILGPTTVIEAINSGREAAKQIDLFLGGDGQIETHWVQRTKLNTAIGNEKNFAYHKRVHPDLLPLSKRLKGVNQVELSINQQEAIAEAKRCLKCRLRLEISKVPLPPEK
jgi:NADPH-dependent glutamate synthase beta subunit-like oxidoreductase/NAD-dependent dihydropyrimidine dehydrogenase PreA subunit